jgi:hypothetical protein
MQFLDIAELLDQPGKDIHFHQGRRLAGLAFGPQRVGAHAAAQIALAHGFDLDETRRFDVVWHPGSRGMSGNRGRAMRNPPPLSRMEQWRQPGVPDKRTRFAVGQADNPQSGAAARRC